MVLSRSRSCFDRHNWGSILDSRFQTPDSKFRIPDTNSNPDSSNLMMNARNLIACCRMILVAIVVLSPSLVLGGELRLLPPTARLDGRHARQRFIVERVETNDLHKESRTSGV